MNSSSEDSLNKGGSKVKGAAKSVAKLATEKGKAKGLINIIFGGLSTSTLGILALVLVILFIPCMILSALPIGDIFQTNKSIESTEKKLYSAVSSAYYNAERKSKDQIAKYVNRNYSCGVRKNDIYESGGKYYVDTDSCSISISFSPSLSEMNENISAYVNAVNGTIAFFGDETKEETQSYYNGTHEEIEKFEGQILTEDGLLTKEAQEFYDAHSDELTNTSDAKYIEDIKAQSSTFFLYDDNEDRWDERNFYLGTKVHEEYQIVGVDEETGEPEYDWVDVEVPAWYGDIGILMFYDLSSYKEDELNNCVENLSESESFYAEDPVGTVGSVLGAYYDGYIGHFKGSYNENGVFVLGRDNRNELFAKLVEDGTLMYVPISGLTSNFLEGSPGYSGSVDKVLYQDAGSREIWKHISELRSSGVIGYRTDMWNCTAFAQAWFYEMYGVNALYGNGRDMVGNLLDPDNELVGDWGSKNFYRGSSPAPGGIFSIGSPAGGNHVGCVEEVDFENKTITFSDGNTNGAANSTSTISIRRTLTFDEFQSYVKACCRHHGNISGCWVTYANPIRTE